MPEHHDEQGTLTEAERTLIDRFVHYRAATEDIAMDGVYAAVERIVAERIAEALRDAADVALTMYDPPVEECITWSEWLRARADYRRIRPGLKQGGDPT